MEEAVLNIVSTVNSYLSNYVLLFGLIFTGLFFTIRTKGVQFRCFGEGWKKMFGELSLSGGDQGGAMSSFQALATAVAAQVGTGNIVGACGAILIGGPGAIFWMWIIALLGMATNYAEATLAQKTKVIDEKGNTHGGPVYYITTAFKGGFGRCFGHSLGHGVGYEVHEAPAVSKKGKMKLKPGMLVTIEPGIYLEGNLGVRIEDLILITENGCEVLSPADATL